MFVIWKRPDGYHNASPEDYYTTLIAGKNKLWLHRSDKKWYPFRISGGWQDEDATTKLNTLVNLIGKDDQEWLQTLTELFDNSKTEDSISFVESSIIWLADLRKCLKGDTWEIEIMDMAISTVEEKLANLKQDFIETIKMHLRN